MKLDELERVLLDQIETLNDNSLFDNEEEARIVVEKSRAISKLVADYVNIQQLKLNIVKELNKNGTAYEQFLGVSDEKLSNNLGCRKRQLDYTK